MKKTRPVNQMLSEANVGDSRKSLFTSGDGSCFPTPKNDRTQDCRTNASRKEDEKAKSLEIFNEIMTALSKSGCKPYNLERRRGDRNDNNVNTLDKDGSIPLVLAAKEGWEDGVDFLLFHEEMDVNVQTQDGQTALSVACAQGHKHIVRKLVLHGSDILLEDKMEATAICHAVSRDHCDIAHFLYDQMDEECKNAFVKRRIDLLSSPKTEGKNLFSFYNKILFPVLLDIKRNMKEGIALLIKNRIFAKLMTCAERCHRDADMLAAIFRLLGCFIYSEEGDGSCVKTDLLEQFVQDKGPETVLRLTKSHSHEYSFQVRIAATIALQTAIEVESGVKWIKENLVDLITLFTEFNSKVRVLNCWQEKERAKVCMMWNKFKEYFHKLCEQSGIYNIITDEKPFCDKGPNPLPRCQKKKNKHIVKPWVKAMDNVRSGERPEIIFDPVTKYNFGPSSQPVDDDLGEYEKVIHNKREKNIAKMSGNKATLEVSNFVVRMNEEPQNNRCPSTTTYFSSNDESIQSIGSKNVAMRTIFNAQLTQNSDSWLQHHRPFKEYLNTAKSDIAQKPKGIEDYLKNVHIANDTAWADGINSSDLIDKWKTSAVINEERSCTLAGPGFNSDDSDCESSAEEEIIQTKMTKKEGTKGEPKSWFDNNIENVKENETSLSLPSSFVEALEEVMTNMMQTLMNRYLSKSENELCEDRPTSKVAGQPPPQWKPQSHRWQSLFSEAVKEAKRERTTIRTYYYVDKDEYIIGRGRFLNYIGLTSENKEVAIKKFSLKGNLKLLNQTISSIKDSVIQNKNVLPIKDVYLTNNWAFFVVELCECNLQEYLMLMGEKSSLACIRNELISQLLNGLNYLHQHQPPVVHGSLRPTNILVSLTGNLVISNFGLLQLWSPPCGILDSSVASHVSVTKCSWRPRECLVSINTAMAKASYTASSDIQLTGMVVHFILTRGNHPFGSNDIECQINIARGRPVYKYFGQEMNDMIGLMLSHDPKQRPSASMALKHPYFWYSEKRLNFLIAVASQPEMTTECSDSVKTRIERACVEAKNWVFKVHPQILQDTFLERSVKKTVADLLRLIFNCVARYRTFSPDVQHLLSSPALYFTDRFPSLVVTIYKVIRESRWKDRKSLSGYF